MGISFGSIAGAALKAAAVLGAGMGIKDMITAADNGQKNLAQMDAVLKSTGGAAGMTKDQLIALADSQGKLTTYSKGANEQTENLLLTFTSIGKKVFPDALKTVNDMSTALGQDTKSSAIQLGKALQDPIKGVSALARVGVNFTAQQKAQIKTMVKVGDTAGAQKLILAELHKEFGGSAEAAGKTFGGALTILRNKMTEVGGNIATNLLPYMNTFIKTITDNMPKIQATISAAIAIIAPKFQEWVKILGQIASEIFPNFNKSVDTAKGSLSGLSGGLNIITGILSFVRDNIGFVKLALDILGIAWVLQKGYVLATNLMYAANIVASGLKKAADFIETAQIWLLIAADTAHSIAQGIATAATVVATTATAAFGAVMAVVTSPIFLVIAAIVALGVIIYELVTHWDLVKQKTGEAWNFIKSAVSSGMSAMGSAIQSGLASVGSFFSALPSEFMNWGIDMMNGLVNGIEAGMSSIGQAASNVAKTITSFLHFSVPDQGPLTDYMNWMPDMLTGMSKSLDANKYKLTDSLKGLTNDMSVSANVAVNSTTGSATGGSIGTSGSNGVNLTITNFYNNSKDDIKSLCEEIQLYLNIKNKGVGGIA